MSGDKREDHRHLHDDRNVDDEHGNHRHHGHFDDMDARVRALESVLVEKGYILSETIDAVVDLYENQIGPRNGARVVARSWVDPEFREWLLTDATAAIASLGLGGRQAEHMVAVENTPDLHNMVVCTLCSCYPVGVLGLPPSWYKSAPYRSRAVVDPRGVLKEFGLEFPDDVRVRVWDSTAEMRYLVIPMRPDGSEEMSEQDLAELVTRECMIGVGLPVIDREVVR